MSFPRRPQARMEFKGDAGRGWHRELHWSQLAWSARHLTTNKSVETLRTDLTLVKQSANELISNWLEIQVVEPLSQFRRTSGWGLRRRFGWLNQIIFADYFRQILPRQRTNLRIALTTGGTKRATSGSHSRASNRVAIGDKANALACRHRMHRRPRHSSKRRGTTIAQLAITSDTGPARVASVRG